MGACKQCVWVCALQLVALVVVSTVIYLGTRVAYPVPTASRSAVVITGASSGLGLDAALRLHSLGFVVYAGVRKTRDGDNLLQLAGGSSRRMRPIKLDVTKEDDVKGAVATVRQALAEEDLVLAGLVNNAGVAIVTALETVPIEALDFQYQVNVAGLLRATQHFLPLLRLRPEQPGRIINVGSVAGVLAPPYHASYASTKHSVEALSDGLRRELRPWHISVSVINTGAMRTPITAKVKSHDGYSAQQCPADLLQTDPASSEPIVIGSNGVPPACWYAHQEATFHDVADQIPMGDPAENSDAIVDALTSTYPYTRYNAGGDAHAIVPLARFLPTRVVDLVGPSVQRKVMEWSPEFMGATSMKARPLDAATQKRAKTAYGDVARSSSSRSSDDDDEEL